MVLSNYSRDREGGLRACGHQTGDQVHSGEKGKTTSKIRVYSEQLDNIRDTLCHFKKSSGEQDRDKQ